MRCGFCYRPAAIIPHNPAEWLATMELQFKVRRIVYHVTQFTYALEYLSSDVSASVRDLVLDTPK